MGLYESVRMEMGSQEVSSGGAMGTAAGAAAAAASARGRMADSGALMRTPDELCGTQDLLLRLERQQQGRAALIQSREVAEARCWCCAGITVLCQCR